MGEPCVLLVDDDPTVRAVLGESLEALGCRLITAGNGEEALWVLRAKPSIDVVVAEVAMPVMGGLELLRIVRQMDRFKALPMILCSAVVDKATMKEAVEQRCGRYLLKPVHPEFLLHQITSLLTQNISRRTVPLERADSRNST